MPVPGSIKRISDTIWEIPTSYKSGMNVPARICASKKLLESMDDGVFEQVTNVACLPGIVSYSFCMPDGHWGYGFPIGGVAAMDTVSGVISPGGIGFDINCGMRLIRTSLTYGEVKPRLKELIDRLFDAVPSGVGKTGFVKISRDDFCDLTENGAEWCLKNGYAEPSDLEFTEERGRLAGADPTYVSERAVDRGLGQVGTLGSGNHYLEIQVAEPANVLDRKNAGIFGINIPDQVVIMLHCGSRGFGHQVATDYLELFLKIAKKRGIVLPERELAYAPFRSEEGQRYFAAMKCAINMSYVNRQVIFHRIRQVFSDVFHKSPSDLGMSQVYDISHNTAMLEYHTVGGRERELLVHRKGATRAFGPGHASLPLAYAEAGQPVIIGGSMETGSYLLAGASTGAGTFFTTAHGSGRTMSRQKAKKQFNGRQLQSDMDHAGIYVKTASFSGLAEEAGAAYKDIEEVAGSAEKAGLSRRIAKFVPVGNIKG